MDCCALHLKNASGVGVTVFSLLYLVRSLLGVATAAVGTIFDLVPDLFPFFAPGEGAIANGAGFRWQIAFLSHGGHSGLGVQSGIDWGTYSRHCKMKRARAGFPADKGDL